MPWLGGATQEIKMAKNTLKALLEAGEFIAAPGVFDLVSAKIAGLTDAKALYMTGFGTVASYLGYPDAGLATYTDMLSRATAIAQAVDKPLIADGDTGVWRPSERPPYGARIRAGGHCHDPARRPADPQKMRPHSGPTRGVHAKDG